MSEWVGQKGERKAGRGQHGGTVVSAVGGVREEGRMIGRIGR